MTSLPTILVALLATGTLLAVALAVALWSSRSQRYTRVRAGELEHLDDLRPVVEGLVQSWATEGNSVEILENRAALQAMVDAIGCASSSIHLELYAWWRGDVCSRFTDALVERARAGVEVRLLLDAIGSWVREEALMDRLREAGIYVRLYHDVRWRTLGRLNKRNHRKLLVLDGRTGFVFGHGVAEEWDGDGDRPDRWRDLGARLEGPVVSRLQAIFAQSWMEESGDLLAGEIYFPSQESVGTVCAQVVASSPRGGVSSSSILYRTLVASARSRLLIVNPYFAPGSEVVALLAQAARRGVEVTIMVPGPHTDAPIVKWAGHHVYTPLLEAGVRIVEFRPTLNHQKVLVVDERCAYLGSANFDERSFDINAEAGVVLWDRELCDRFARIFERDLESCDEVSLASWRRRAFWRRLRERAAFLLHQQL